VTPLLLRSDTDQNAAQLVSAGREDFRAIVDFEPVRVGLSGVPGSHYVSEILYNGVSIKGRFAEIDPAAISQLVQFKVSDKASTVQGKVSKEDAPAAATVLLIPWPLNPQSDFPAYFDAEAGDDGKFSIRGLPPGAYHALAVSASSWSEELQKPGVLATLAAGAKEISLDPAATQEVSLELGYVAPQ
jgi:hypothetical protein